LSGTAVTGEARVSFPWYRGIHHQVLPKWPKCDESRAAAGLRGRREGANHAFNNDTSAARYDKKAADLAWGRTVAFLKEKLA